MQFFTPAELRQVVALPLFSDQVPCGFLSPAQDYVEQRIDLNELKEDSVANYVAAAEIMVGFLFHRPDAVVVGGAKRVN